MFKKRIIKPEQAVWEGSTFHFHITDNGSEIDIKYKQGLMPKYHKGMIISKTDLREFMELMAFLEIVPEE